MLLDPPSLLIRRPERKYSSSLRSSPMPDIEVTVVASTRTRHSHTVLWGKAMSTWDRRQRQRQASHARIDGAHTRCSWPASALASRPNHGSTASFFFGLLRAALDSVEILT
ncbi:hypothetical protein L1887_59636 [Cichorium endivia]|nr:hypothetical protein L1887_59636 [Cichorium endivia]